MPWQKFFFFSFSPFPCKGGLRSLGTSGHQQHAAQLPSAGNFLAPATQKPSSGGAPPPFPFLLLPIISKCNRRREKALAGRDTLLRGCAGSRGRAALQLLFQPCCREAAGGDAAAAPGCRGGSGGEQEAAASPPLPSPGPCRRCPPGLCGARRCTHRGSGAERRRGWCRVLGEREGKGKKEKKNEGRGNKK